MHFPYVQVLCLGKSIELAQFRVRSDLMRHKLGQLGTTCAILRLTRCSQETP